MDDATLQFYRQNAEAYAKRTITSRQVRLTKFLACLTPGAAILELGCGAGADTKEIIARGFDVTPTDGSPEMAEIASRHLGRPVGTLLFHRADQQAAVGSAHDAERLRGGVLLPDEILGVDQVDRILCGIPKARMVSEICLRRRPIAVPPSPDQLVTKQGRIRLRSVGLGERRFQGREVGPTA